MEDSEFDAATRLSGDGPAFGASLPAGWGGQISVNGGFMLSLLTRAMARIAPFPDPVVVSGFYLRPGSAGPASVAVELIRSGRTTAFTQGSLRQDGKETLRATAAFTDLAKAAGRSGLLHAGGTAPTLPPPDECVSLLAGAIPGVSIAGHFEYRGVEEPGWSRGEPSGNPAAEFYMRFRHGVEADITSLPLFVDAAAPAVLSVGARQVTTIELTVHLRARPAPGWFSCRASTRFLTDSGYHEEDFEIWDSAGTLVAQSRQLALLLSLSLDPDLGRLASDAASGAGGVDRPDLDRRRAGPGVHREHDLPGRRELRARAEVPERDGGLRD
jgi:acyl-coenzyme A thioesterase PaaI-like protein